MVEEFTGSPQDVADQVERLRSLDRSLEVRARNRLLTGMLGLAGFGVTLLSHMVLHPGQRIPLTSFEQISLAVSALVAVAGTVAFQFSRRPDSRRLRLAAGLLRFFSSGPVTLTLDLNCPQSDSYDQTWLTLQVEAVSLSVRRLGTSWLRQGQRQYRYHEICEIVTTAPMPPLDPLPPQSRLANLSLEQNQQECRIRVQSPTTTLDALENLEAADLLGLLQRLRADRSRCG